MLQASVASELQRAKGGGRHGYQGYFCKPSHTPRHSEGRERAGWRSSRGTVCEPNGLRRAGRTHDARLVRPRGTRCRGGIRGREQRQVQAQIRSEEHTSELQSLMRNSYAVFCLKKKTKKS